MPAASAPYPDVESASVPADSDAFIPVRVVEPARPDGSRLVYLPGGTAFVVNSRYLLRRDPNEQ
jgi:hypothetical protein